MNQYLFISAYYQQVRPPSGQRKSGVMTPASYVPQQTVTSANFPFASKQLSARPKSHIGIPSLESRNSGVNFERQTHSPKTPSPIAQHKSSVPSQSRVTSVSNNACTNYHSDVAGDMNKLSLDPEGSDQSRGGHNIGSRSSTPGIIFKTELFIVRV